MFSMEEMPKKSRGHSWRREHEELKQRKIHKLEKKIGVENEIENSETSEDHNISSSHEKGNNEPDNIKIKASCEEDEKNKDNYQQIDQEKLSKLPSPPIPNEISFNIIDSEEKIALEEAQEREILISFKNEMTEKFNKMIEIRNYNIQVLGNKIEDNLCIKLDSNVKKNTSFIKKVRHFTTNQYEQLMKELKTLNLSKYISEFASAIVECKLKMSDIDPAVNLCIAVYQRYCDVSAHLLENWQKILSIKKDDKNVNHSKLRVDIRFYCELINNGIFTHKESLPLLGNVLTCLINNDKEDHNNIAIILSFCRHCGLEYAGLVPKTILKLSEKHNMVIEPLHILAKDKQKNVKILLKDYYQSLTKHLIKEHNELCFFKKQNKKILQTKGELSAERKSKLDQMVISYQRLITNAETFAEFLNEELTDLTIDDEGKTESLTAKSEDLYESCKNENFWEDEDSQQFYQDLIDLKEYIPGVIGLKQDPQLEEEVTEELGDPDSLEELIIDEKIVDPDIDDEIEGSTNATNKQIWEAFSIDLPKAVSRISIDTMVIEFTMNLNTKQNRRKLTKLLFNVPRIRLDLLPFYSRFVATLYPIQPDIGNDLCNLLKNDFRFHIKKKDQMNIESKIKVVRFIGELVKFNIFLKSDVLFFIKTLLNDFEHHHIEMCTNLIECCGLYLYRNRSTTQRIEIYLELMMRKKNVMVLDSRYVTMIENAYFAVIPPQDQKQEVYDEPNLFSFIRNSLFHDLNKSNSNDIINFLMKIDWNDKEIEMFIIECLSKAYMVKYYNIKHLAGLTAVLALHYKHVGVMVVDNVLEDIKSGLEINHPKYNQRRIAMIRYIGELYNYRMLETNDLITVLYTLITFGINLNYNNISIHDPPNNLFRIRLVCILLETSGRYFSHSSSLKKLLYFIVFFQNYYLFKYCDSIWTKDNPFPVTMEYLYQDTLKSIDPKIKFCQTFEESQLEVMNLQYKLAASIETELPMSPIPYQISDNIPGERGQEDESDEEEDEVTRKEVVEDEDEEEISLAYEDNIDIIPSEENSQSQNEDVPSLLGPNVVNCSEDDEFQLAFERMLADNYQERIREQIKPQCTDIAVPIHIRSNSKKTYEQLKESSNEEKSTINFTLMLRKGHKKQYKNLEVPVTSDLAKNLKNKEEAEREEKEKFKKLTLDINERLEEEDYQEMLNQNRPVVMNLNRERRVKYQHPKGAPDADLIFGKKLK